MESQGAGRANERNPTVSWFEGRLGAQGWAQIGCGLIILAVGVILIPPPTTSTYEVIALGSAVVVVTR